MIINIYPSRCTLYQGDYVATEWIAYSYDEKPKLATRTETGFVKVRDPLPPIGIKAHFARLIEGGQWVKLMDGHLYCAWHLYLFAEASKKGVRFAKPEPRKENTCREMNSSSLTVRSPSTS